MIEAVHFNEQKPENKNIAFTDKKDNRIKVCSNDKWIYKDKDDIINDLIDGKYFVLDNHYDKVCENLNMNANIHMKNLEHFLTKKIKYFMIN